MRLLIVAATPFEIAPTLAWLDQNAERRGFFDYYYQDKIISTLVTGVGMMQTAFAIARYNRISEVSCAIQIGVAGSYQHNLFLGSVVQVTKDRYADLGVEEADGSFTDVFELGLMPDQPSLYENGWLQNTLDFNLDIPKVKGLTVNRVHGHEKSIHAIRQKYPADVETMETAAFMYACNQIDVAYLALRGISNYVEPRNREGWQLEQAITEVNKVFISSLPTFQIPKKAPLKY